MIDLYFNWEKIAVVTKNLKRDGGGGQSERGKEWGPWGFGAASHGKPPMDPAKLTQVKIVILVEAEPYAAASSKCKLSEGSDVEESKSTELGIEDKLVPVHLIQ